MKRKKTVLLSFTKEKTTFSHVFLIMFIFSVIMNCPLRALPGSCGTPLGGIGTGYLKFNAVTGDFAASSRIPPAAGDMKYEFTNRMSKSSGFHFFAGGQSVKKAKTVNEDAKCPLYSAHFGKTNTITFSLNSFGPVISGDNELNIKLASSPLAFFEIIAENEGDSALDVAVALEFTNASDSISGLLGGADTGEIDSASGINAISFPTSTFDDIPSNPDNIGNAYMMVECNKEGAKLSAGSLGDFLTTGTLLKNSGNCIAAKYTLDPEECVRFKFVISWWRSFISGIDRYQSGKNDNDNFFYHNYYQTSRDAAVFGMQHFDRVRNGILSMVNRVMGSNFPDWYKEKLLNNTYPLIQNSLWTEDGRAAFWEGNYGIIGTIDQGEHAAVWYTLNWPKNQWMELAYWLKTARQEPELKGQIHHDFNISPGLTLDPPESRFMAPWNNWDRDDYWYQPNTSEWSDLNTMIIFKAYELMLATGNLDSMRSYFPLILNTAERLLKQCTDGGGYLPIKSKSTYDTEKYGTPQYATGIALTAFLAVEKMARFIGDSESVIKYRDWYTEARKEFRALMFNSNFCTGRNFAEGDVAGYSWANYFCLEPVMDSDVINEGCRRLWNLYTSSASTVQEKLGRWHFYTCDHWGGSEIGRGRPDTAMMILKWDYDYYHTVRKDMVFWQDLWGDLGRYASYMTAPSVWRSYLQMTGYLLDNANKRLWIRPRIPSEMNNRVVNAPLPNPYGWGNLNFDGRIVEVPGQTAKLTQTLTVTYDSLVTVNEIVLNNNTGVNNPFIIITNANSPLNGFTCTTEGDIPEKNISLSFSEPVQIGPSGLHIDVFTEQVVTSKTYQGSQKYPFTISTNTIAAGRPIQFSVNTTGLFTIELLTLSGVKIGTLMRRIIATPGRQTYIWNGSTLAGEKVASMITVLRLCSSNRSVCKRVTIFVK